jgi:TolB protein
MKSIQLVGLLVLSLSACTLLHTVEAALPDVASQATATRPPNVFCGSRSDGAYLLFTPTHPASAQNPAFSPDGKIILFTIFHQGYNNGPAGLYLLPLTSNVISTLIFDNDQDSVNLPGSCWNDDTNRITFSSDREDTDEIWIISPDGSNPLRLTHHTSATFFYEPSFSPNGQWIVFEVDNDAPEYKQVGSIWKIRIDGSGLTRLVGGPGTGRDDRQPNWSPLVDRILFQRRLVGTDDWNLFTMAPDGSDIQQVTDTPSGDTDASWSPDGKWIVYSTDFGAAPIPNIFVIPAAGGTPVRITYDDIHEDGAPSWSPDGKWIAFESHKNENEDSPTSLWMIAVPNLNP